jgi:H+-translocating NAD(P) transhydrogenase subunit beta
VSGEDLVQLAYLVSVGLFVVGLKRLSGVRSARRGNQLLAAGMLLAVVTTLVEQEQLDVLWIAVGLALGIAVGLVTVVRATATSMPQVVARFNGFGGAASALVALALFWQEVVEPSDTPGIEVLGGLAAGTLVLSVLIGGATFSGSVIAEAKLWGKLGGLGRLPARQLLVVVTALAAIGAAVGAIVLGDAQQAALVMGALVVVSLVAGIVTVGPVGGADMPVMISLLNSLSGLAAAATGFALGNTLLIMAGTIVGAAGLMLTRIMCAAMNRTLLNVLAGGFGGDTAATGDASEYTSIVSSDAEEAAMVLEVARSVVIVPGYGLAAARGQHAAAELAETLAQRGVDVRFAIHPIAGRMPGHMNVVLAEADVPYERLVEMERINRDFASTDVVIVVGANDVINPAARTASGSPISGMPILEVDAADRVFVIKRSLSPGYSGIKNELFEADNCVLLFGDAKQVLDDLVGHLHDIVS